MPKEHETSTELSRLQRNYAKTALQTAKEIQRAFEAWLAEPTEDEFQILYTTSHQLTGTAGTYGYVRLSLVAEMLCESLDALSDEASKPSADACAILEVIIDNLYSCADAKPDVVLQ